MQSYKSLLFVSSLTLKLDKSEVNNIYNENNLNIKKNYTESSGNLLKMKHDNFENKKQFLSNNNKRINFVNNQNDNDNENNKKLNSTKENIINFSDVKNDCNNFNENHKNLILSSGKKETFKNTNILNFFKRNNNEDNEQQKQLMSDLALNSQEKKFSKIKNNIISSINNNIIRIEENKNIENKKKINPVINLLFTNLSYNLEIDKTNKNIQNKFSENCILKDNNLNLKSECLENSNIDSSTDYKSYNLKNWNSSEDIIMTPTSQKKIDTKFRDKIFNSIKDFNNLINSYKLNTKIGVIDFNVHYLNENITFPIITEIENNINNINFSNNIIHNFSTNVNNENMKSNKKSENENKIQDDLNCLEIKYFYMDLLKKKFENYEIYKNFCDSISCEQGCFLKYLKLNNELKELIWKKFGAQNVYLGEIKELYFEKLFSIFKFDPCRISKFLRILDKKNNIDYEVSCFSVKKNIFKNFF